MGLEFPKNKNQHGRIRMQNIKREAEIYSTTLLVKLTILKDFPEVPVTRGPMCLEKMAQAVLRFQPLIPQGDQPTKIFSWSGVSMKASPKKLDRRQVCEPESE